MPFQGREPQSFATLSDDERKKAESVRAHIETILTEFIQDDPITKVWVL
jgi:hypothetical protein